MRGRDAWRTHSGALPACFAGTQRISLARSGSRGTRADQGVRPTAVRIAGLGTSADAARMSACATHLSRVAL